MIVVDIIILILSLGIIISIHEFGHFFTAKLAGVLCSEFSIGMGPAIYTKKKAGKETRFSIRAIPFGGYAAMAGEDEASSYLVKGERVGLILDSKKWVKEVILDPDKFKHADITGSVEYFNTYDDSKRLYITIKTSEDKLYRYYINPKMEYVFLKNKKEQNAPKSRSFEAQEKFPRFLILFAGPMMNFLLALFLLFFVFLINGKPVNTNRLGYSESFVSESLKNMGIRRGDRLVEIDGHEINETDGFYALNKYLSNIDNIKNKYKLKFKTSTNDYKEVLLNPRISITSIGLTNENYESMEEVVVGKFHKGLKKEIKPGYKIVKIGNREVKTWKDAIKAVDDYLKDGKLVEINITYKNDKGEIKTTSKKIKLISEKVLKEQGAPLYQISLGISAKGSFDFFYSVEASIKTMWKITRRTLDTIKSLFDTTSGIGITDLSGPVGIFSLVQRARQRSFSDLLFLIAFLSINIGFLNLLPIPALDGGRIMFLIIETLSGRKISKKIESRVNIIMFFILLALMVAVIGFDIVKLI